MEHVGFAIDAMQAIGGGSVSPLWTQIIADVTERRLNVVQHPLEAGAMGAALTVAVGLGVYPDMDAVDDLIAVKARGGAAGGQPRRLRPHVRHLPPALRRPGAHLPGGQQQA